MCKPLPRGSAVFVERARAFTAMLVAKGKLLGHPISSVRLTPFYDDCWEKRGRYTTQMLLQAMQATPSPIAPFTIDITDAVDYFNGSKGVGACEHVEKRRGALVRRLNLCARR